MIRSYAETPLQSNPTWAKPPWTSYGNRVEIQERIEALDTSRLLRIAGFPTLYTDAASGKRLTGCVTVLSRGHELRVIQKESIEWSSTASVLGAELAAIVETVEYAWKHINDTRLVIMSDSQHALKAIAQGYSHGSKQAQVARIIWQHLSASHSSNRSASATVADRRLSDQAGSTIRWDSLQS
jgi:ribonuclease HI